MIGSLSKLSSLITLKNSLYQKLAHTFSNAHVVANCFTIVLDANDCGWKAFEKDGVLNIPFRSTAVQSEPVSMTLEVNVYCNV